MDYLNYCVNKVQNVKNRMVIQCSKTGVNMRCLELMFPVFLIVQKDPPLKEHQYKWSNNAVTSEYLTQDLIGMVSKSPLSKLQKVSNLIPF